MSLVDEFKKLVEGRKRNPIHNFGDKRAAPFKKKNKSAKNEALDCKYLSDGNCTIGCESESVELEAACPFVEDSIFANCDCFSDVVEESRKIKESHIISESVEVKLGDVFKLDDDTYHLVVDNDPASFRTVSFNSDSEGYRYIGSIVSELDLDTSVVSLWTDPVDFADKIIQHIDNFYEFDVEDLSAEVAVVTMADQESPEYFESDDEDEDSDYDDEDDDSDYDDEDDGSIDVTYINNENYLGKFGSCHLFLKKTKS